MGLRTTRNRQASKQRLYRSPPGRLRSRRMCRRRTLQNRRKRVASRRRRRCRRRCRCSTTTMTTRVDRRGFLKGSALFAAASAWPGASGPRAGARRSRRPTPGEKKDEAAEEEAAARQGRPRIPRLRHVRRQHVQAGEDLDLRAVRVQLRGIAVAVVDRTCFQQFERGRAALPAERRRAPPARPRISSTSSTRPSSSALASSACSSMRRGPRRVVQTRPASAPARSAAAAPGCGSRVSPAS